MQNYAQTNRFQYLGDILILTGLVFVCGSVFGILGLLVTASIFKINFQDFITLLSDKSWMEHMGLVKLVNTASSFGAWVASGFLLFKIRGYRRREFWNFDTPAIERTWLLLPFLFISSIFVASLLLYFNQQMNFPESLKQSLGGDESQKLMEKMLLMNGPGELMMNILVIALVPALFEEIFFRGTLQPLITGFTGNPHLGIAVSSLIFAAIHLNIMQIIPMFFLAMVLGYLFYYTKSLIPGIILHFCNNALAVLANYYKDSSWLARKVADDTYVPGVWESILFVVILGGIFYYFHRQKSMIKTDE